ncbi:PKD domain-containing protein [Pseudoalteromonas sp. T1lg24]|uniref:PKD domain-containing protein n=1 Tax=Pseudoalteromonas sp. T1lg24 TaxID=2077099 RepID=UPI000CF6E5E4|nr:hypothetical protein [Pseudoalteromonas sp. T1lg24]
MYQRTLIKFFLFTTLFGLVACGGSSKKPKPQVNNSPIVNAGADFHVNEANEVNLLATASDPDGSITTINWQQTAGLQVDLLNSNSLTPSFVAPTVAVGEQQTQITLQITATDNQGASSSDNITITINAVNEAPIVNAGEDIEVNEKQLVEITATASDDDNKIKSILWQQISGTPALIDDINSLKLSFVVPSIPLSQQQDKLVFQVMVTDELGLTAEDDIVVTVNPLSRAPIANAGADKTYLLSELIHLDCSLSSDPNNYQLSYNWQQTQGDEILIEQATSCNPSFTLPNQPSQIDVMLTVTNELGLASQDTVRITAREYQGNLNEIGQDKVILQSKLNSNGIYHLSLNPEKGIAFVSDSNILTAVDVSEPFALKPHTWQGTSGTCQSSFSQGNFLVASCVDELRFFDISDLNNIQLVSTVRTNTSFNNFELSGNLLLASAPRNVGSNQTDRIVALDISNLNNVLFLDISTINNVFNANEAWVSGLAIKGKTLFTAANDGMLRIFDISNITATSLIATLDLEVPLGEIAVTGTSLSVAATTKGVVLVDITETSNPIIATNITAPQGAYNLSQNANVLSVASTSFNEIMFFDVSNLNSPILIGKKTEAFRGVGLFLQNDTLFYLDSSLAALISQDVSNLSGLAGVEIMPSAGTKISSIAASNNKLFFSSDDNRLVSASITNNNNLAIQASLDVSQANNITLMDNQLFLAANDNSLKLVDVADGNKLTLTSQLQVDEAISAIIPHGNNVLISEGNSKLQLLDVSKAEVIKPISELILNSGQTIGDIDSDGLSIITATKDNSSIVQLNSSGELESIANISFDLAPDEDGWEYNSVVIYKNYAYLLAKYYGLRILDISNPKSPKSVKSISDISGSQLKLIDNKLFVIDPFSGVSIYGLNDPTEPRQLSSYLTRNSIYKVAIDSEKVYNLERVRTNHHDWTFWPLKETFSLVDFTKSIKLKQSYSLVNTDSNLSYDATWQLDGPVKLVCIVTGGSCSVEQDTASKTAKIIWQIPSDAGDHLISVLLANSNFYDVAEDSVIVE